MHVCNGWQAAGTLAPVGASQKKTVHFSLPTIKKGQDSILW